MAIDKLVEQIADAGNKRESSGVGRYARMAIGLALVIGVSALVLIVACFR